MSNKRTWPTLAVLVVAVLALALGSVSTAVAGGLTKQSVKKIATKVVKKQSSSLSVASAATAGNANTVGGLPASALQERRTVYTATMSTGATSLVRAIPLPGPGSYEISYSAFLEATASTSSECWIQRQDAAATILQFYADDASSGVTFRTAHSASDVITVAAGQVVKLGCAVDSGTFTTNANEPIQVVVTPLDSVATGVLTRAQGTSPKS